MEENKENQNLENKENQEAIKDKKKPSLADFKVKSFVTKVKVEQMQFLKTAGG